MNRTVVFGGSHGRTFRGRGTGFLYLNRTPNSRNRSSGFFMARSGQDEFMEQGLVQVYTGEGKGKTTASIGLAVRALGQGMKVLLVRFLKPAEPLSGEIAFLEGASGLQVLTSGLGIIGKKPDRQAVAANVAETFAAVRRLLIRDNFDLVILDEINNAVHRGYLPLEALIELLDARPAGTELVLTGRNAAEAILQRADLVTRMEAVRHPLKAGIPARRGVEY